MTMQFLACEAAAAFGLALDDFKRRAVERQAEMMAHVLLKEARDSYIEHLREEASKRKQKRKTGFNPAEKQRKKWMIK